MHLECQRSSDPLITGETLRNIRINMKAKKIDLYILGFIILNIVQAILTPVLEDEAYYWMFSKNLDFGYFDHPPMVAFIIKLSSYLFSGTLGIRFVTVLLLALTIKISWTLIPSKYKANHYAELIFMGIIFSIPIFNIYGFITTPDVPLLFFSSLFLLTLKNLLKKDSFFNILFFGVSAALLIYSKYHGVIVILLGVLFKLELLKKRSTYVAGVVALLCIFPHFYWQYQNDFITFNFHLFQRTSGEFNFENVLHYLSSTFGILNPALILLFFIYLKKKSTFRQENKFLIRMFLGFLIFFFFYSFRSRIEAHWVAFSAIPFAILLYKLSISDDKIKKQIKYIGIITILLISSARILIILDIPLKSEFHTKKKNYFQAISALADGRKVVFVNSYQKASKYHFYMGEESFSDNDVYYRKNQYDILNYEDNFHNNDVLFISNWPSKYYDTLNLKSDGLIFYKKIDNYPIFNKLQAKINHDDFNILKNKGEIDVTIYNPYNYDIDLQQKKLPYEIKFCLTKGDDMFYVPLKIDKVKRLQSKMEHKITAQWDSINRLPGEYELRIIMNAGYLYPKVLSKKYHITLE